MTSPVLFSTGASPVASGSSRNLVEFKAGKMEMRDKMVYPTTKKGLVFLRQSPDDSLMHFCWKDRQTGVTEDDLILFPDDCEFKRVKECTTGRVYVLKMKSSNKKMFFWMQESKTDRDDEYCKKINEMLNNPPRAGSDMSGGSQSERDLQQLFGVMSQEQIAHILSSNGVNLGALLNSTGRSPSSNSGASASSTASTINSAPTSATSAIGGTNAPSGTGSARDSSSIVNDLRALLSEYDGREDDVSALMAASMGANGTPNASATLSSGSTSQRDTQQPLVDLSTAINSDSLAYLLEDGEFLRLIEPHLPSIGSTSSTDQQQTTSDEGRRNQFSSTVRSSQFKSSLSQFCVALQSGQLGPLISQFGLNQDCVEAANLGNLEAFVRALDAQMTSTRTPISGQPSQPRSDSKDKS